MDEQYTGILGNFNFCYNVVCYYPSVDRLYFYNQKLGHNAIKSCKSAIS
jgi:hypothetical protein